jgi:hypothetical protein
LIIVLHPIDRRPALWTGATVSNDNPLAVWLNIRDRDRLVATQAESLTGVQFASGSRLLYVAHPRCQILAIDKDVAASILPIGQT